jgi:hypothetical protein
MATPWTDRCSRRHLGAIQRWWRTWSHQCVTLVRNLATYGFNGIVPASGAPPSPASVSLRRSGSDQGTTSKGTGPVFPLARLSATERPWVSTLPRYRDCDIAARCSLLKAGCQPCKVQRPKLVPTITDKVSGGAAKSGGSTRQVHPQTSSSLTLANSSGGNRSWGGPQVVEIWSPGRRNGISRDVSTRPQPHARPDCLASAREWMLDDLGR